MRDAGWTKTLAATTLAAAGLAHAQVQSPLPVPFLPAAPASAARGPSEAASRLRQVCSTLPPQAVDARASAQRAECVMLGLLPSAHPYAQARELARQSLAAGEPAGGYVLYLVFNNDPENSYVRDGKPDLARYQELAARGMDQRSDQVEAIDGLAFAASKGMVNAGILLAHYFENTVAPRNVARLRAMVDLLGSNGQRNADLERLGRAAVAVQQAAPATKASVRAFMDAYRAASAAATQGYGAQTAGKTCRSATLRSVSVGDIEGAQYLPLKSLMAADSYLVRGQWPEYWTFRACGEDVPITVTFVADGWGGATFSAVHNKGE